MQEQNDSASKSLKSLYLQLNQCETGIDAGMPSKKTEQKRILEQICTRDPLDHISLFKLAELIQNEEGRQNAELENVDPCSVFEKSLQQNKASVEVWEAYLKFSFQFCKEATTRLNFERAMQNVGHSLRSVNLWLMWIDFETMYSNWAKCNLLCYLALKTPLIDND